MIVGVLGGGQLGRMLALAGYPLGLRFRFLDPSSSSPAGQVGHRIAGEFEDEEALERFAEGLEVVTYEFENVSVQAARHLERRVPVYPPPQALEAAQDRLPEKTLFQSLGIPVPPFAPIDTKQELECALQRIGLPAVLKTRRLGYDGKGQWVLREPGDAERVWSSLEPPSPPLLVEGLVPFEREVSLLAVRSRQGETAFYPLVENHHREGILRLSLAPAPGLTPEIQAQAQAYGERLLNALDYTGVLAIEFFQCQGRLLANEMAPRVHNSGHWTIEGAETSQFENHLRAILGLPLGSTALRGMSAMLNLIGTMPDTAAILNVPGAHLHLYGKTPRPGRKLGHITLRAEDPTLLETRVAQIRALGC
jgi:5-(carboxyamino)imidazole ribonucleotide synthase